MIAFFFFNNDAMRHPPPQLPKQRRATNKRSVIKLDHKHPSADKPEDKGASNKARSRIHVYTGRNPVADYGVPPELNKSRETKPFVQNDEIKMISMQSIHKPHSLPKGQPSINARRSGCIECSIPIRSHIARRSFSQWVIVHWSPRRIKLFPIRVIAICRNH